MAMGVTMIDTQADAYRVAGFLSLGDRLHFDCPQSYADWFGCSWTRRELREDLHFGKLPEGLILMTPVGLRVVLGRQGAYAQMLGYMTHGEACLAVEAPKKPAQEKRGPPAAAEIVGMLREYRQWKGMSVREMAPMLGISAAGLYRLVDLHRKGKPIRVHARVYRALVVFYGRYIRAHEDGN